MGLNSESPLTKCVCVIVGSLLRCVCVGPLRGGRWGCGWGGSWGGGGGVDGWREGGGVCVEAGEEVVWGVWCRCSGSVGVLL